MLCLDEKRKEAEKNEEQKKTKRNLVDRLDYLMLKKEKSKMKAKMKREARKKKKKKNKHIG